MKFNTCFFSWSLTLLYHVVFLQRNDPAIGAHIPLLLDLSPTLHSTPLGHHQLELPVLYNTFLKELSVLHMICIHVHPKTPHQQSQILNPIKKWAEDLNQTFIQRRNTDGQETQEKMPQHH